MIQPRRIGTKNAAPQMRAEYGQHIKQILCHVPPDWVLDKGMFRTLVFLDNLADYLIVWRGKPRHPWRGRIAPTATLS